MIFSIPGEFISLITFPGVILHEVAHRFFCDILGIRVYQIEYFNLGTKISGHVLHEPTNNKKHDLLIAIAPLLINSIVCMLLTFTYGTKVFLGTNFISEFSSFDTIIDSIVIWAGYSIGFNAIPSNKDIENLTDYDSKFRNFFICLTWICNLDYIGPWLHILYAYGISMILPAIYWYCI